MASRFLVPFASGRGLMGGDPLLDLHREMNRLFDDVFRGSSGQGGSSSLASMPRLDMHESDNELCVTADLPGVTPADVDLQIDRDVLTISGERKGENEQKQQNYHLMERSYGRFQRQVQLPFAPDPGQVRANFEHGVLTVRIRVRRSSSAVGASRCAPVPSRRSSRSACRAVQAPGRARAITGRPLRATSVSSRRRGVETAAGRARERGAHPGEAQVARVRRLPLRRLA